MNLTLVIYSLSAGGAERVMSIMANYWAVKGYSITLLTMDDGSVPPFYDLDCRVKHISLDIAKKSPNFFHAIWNNIKRVLILRNAIIQEKPDTVISFLDTTNVTTILSTRGLKIPVIVEEHIYPAMYPIGRSWHLLRRLFYPQANKVVAISERALNYFSSQLSKQGCVIPNPILPTNLQEVCTSNLVTKPCFIAMGRLEEQKGFDLLLQAFAKVRNKHAQWTLTILGEGSQRSQLESLRAQLGLQDCVDLLGVVKNPYNFLKQADIFVMSSRYEGFPNALCEALVCGLPVISTDCPSGPKEIIRDGIDGILVPTENVSALAAAMDRLVSDENERQRLASRAPEIIERFGLEKIMGMWEALIDEVRREMPSYASTKKNLQ